MWLILSISFSTILISSPSKGLTSICRDSLDPNLLDLDFQRIKKETFKREEKSFIRGMKEYVHKEMIK